MSICERDELRDLTGDPWDGRTLEWATSSPPPAYNFAFTPVVHGHDAWWDMKTHGYVRPSRGFRPIHMPKNTAGGDVSSPASRRCLRWRSSGASGGWPLLSFAGLIATAIAHTFNYDRDYDMPAAEVAATERCADAAPGGRGLSR